MERSYQDVMVKSTNELLDELVELRVERYMNDPVMLKDMLREMVEREVVHMARIDAIDALYSEGYWA